MSIDPAPEEALTIAAERFDAAGVRMTRGRRAVLGALFRAGGPVTVDELATLLDSEIPVSSLYRTLGVLVDAGVAVRVHERGGVARFEAAEDLAGHHHHLVCRVCGRVLDIPAVPDEDAELQRIVSAAARRAGFAVTGHHVDIEGVCSSCRAA